jgi:hypothetical protein
MLVLLAGTASALVTSVVVIVEEQEGPESGAGQEEVTE